MPEFFTTHELPIGSPNRLKGLLTSTNAQALTNGLLLLTEPVIVRLEPDGATNLVANSPACFVDPKLRIAFSTNRLTLTATNGQMSLEGRGFLCLLTNFNLTLSNQVYTRIPQQMARSVQHEKSPGGNLLLPGPAALTNAAAGTNAFIEIFSDWANFDYPSNRAVYRGQVRVENPPLGMRSDKLAIQRATNGAVESILAEPNVAITNTQNQSWATGDRALYQMKAGAETLLLTGKPAVWRDAERTMRARRMLYDTKRQNLRAEEAASLRFPRANMDQSGWLPTGSGRTNTPAAGTNQFVDITAAVLDFQMPATNSNRAGRTLVAQTNVVIASVADQSRATADRAIYRETNSTFELIGHAVWQRGDQIMRGERLLFDNSNKVFQAEERAYLRVPAADLRFDGQNKGGLSGAAGGQRKSAKNAKQGTNANAAAALAAQTTNQMPPQFIEVTSDRYEYRNETLTFQGRVNGRLLEGTNTQATLTCGWLSLKFTSNRIERLEARQEVHIEQLPYVAGNGALAMKKFQSEYLLITMNTNGSARRAVATTNVVIHQTELSPGADKPKFSWLSAETTTADFFPQTNLVEKLVAEKNVFMRQDDRSASGDRAVYTATNNQVELTGNPTAEMPQMKIPSAQVIIWDRTHNRFLVDRPKVEGTVPAKATNAAPTINKIDQSISTQTPPPKKSKKPTARPWR